MLLTAFIQFVVQNRIEILTVDMNKFNMANNNSSNGSGKTRGRLIYSVQEANEVAKDGSVNKVRLRYK